MPCLWYVWPPRYPIGRSPYYEKILFSAGNNARVMCRHTDMV